MARRVSFAKRIRVPPHVLVRLVEGEAVLLNLSSERYYGLDEVGARMWTVLTSASCIQEAYESLLQEYEVEAGQLRQNLEELVEELRQNGLVEVGSG